MPGLGTALKVAKKSKKALKGGKKLAGAVDPGAVKANARKLSKPLKKPLKKPLRAGRAIGEQIAGNARRGSRYAAHLASAEGGSKAPSTIVKKELVEAPIRSVGRAIRKPSAKNIATAALDVAAVAPIPAGRAPKAAKAVRTARAAKALRSIRGGKIITSKPVRAALGSAAGVALYRRLKGKGSFNMSASSPALSKAEGLRAVRRVSAQRGEEGIRALRSGLHETRRITTSKAGKGLSTNERASLLRAQTALSYRRELSRRNR